MSSTRHKRFSAVVLYVPRDDIRAHLVNVVHVTSSCSKKAAVAAQRKTWKEIEPRLTEAERKVMTSDDLVVHSVFHGHVRDAK